MSSLKVLIIDDEMCVRASVATLLESDGWQVIEAVNGDEGLALAVSEHPDLIVLDVMMPGMDGFRVYKEIREDSRTAHIPVIMLTAVNDFELGTRRDAETMAEDLRVPPPQGFVEKPFDGNYLLSMAHAVTGS